MRLGTLQLADKWDDDQANEVIYRFRLLEEAITDLQQPPYAHIYVSQDPGITLSLSPSGTTCVLTGATANHIGGFDFTATSRLTCKSPAHYSVNYSISLSVGTVPKHVEVAVIKNGIWQSASASHFDFQTAAIETTLFGSVVLELQRDDYIEIGARCVASTTIITYEHFNSIAVRISF